MGKLGEMGRGEVGGNREGELGKVMENSGSGKYGKCCR